MSDLVAEIAGKIRLLSGAEKNDLLHLLLQEIDGAAHLDADEAWRFEIERRVKAIHRGEAALLQIDDLRSIPARERERT
jgi:hypothetical protein